MKRLIILVIAMLLLSVPVTASDKFELTNAGYTIRIDNKPLSSELPFLNYNGNTYVPLRAVLEAMNAKVEWVDGNVNIKSHRDMSLEDIAKQAANCVRLVIYSKGVAIDRGSGVLLPNGYILTSRYPSDLGDGWEIFYGDDKEKKSYFTDKRVPLDTGLGMALIKSPAEKKSTIKFGDSDKCSVGNKVVLISSPFGQTNTVLNDYISRLDDSSGFRQIQTTIEVMKGSTGGALFNMDGELIGIVTGGFFESDKISMSLAVNEIKKVLGKAKLD